MSSENFRRGFLLEVTRDPGGRPGQRWHALGVEEEHHGHHRKVLRGRRQQRRRRSGACRQDG